MKIALLLLASVIALSAQDANKPGRSWQYGMTALPSASTSITTNNILVDYIYLVNTSASSVAVTVVDQSTNCNSGPCTLVPGGSIAANSIWSIPVNGAPAMGGIKWSAGTANVIHGWIAGRY